MIETNPYTPPASADPSTREGELWHTEGIGVLVRDGAVFPSIDLETAEEGDDLVQVKRKFVKPHWIGSLGIIALPFFHFIDRKLKTEFGIFFTFALLLGSFLVTTIVSKCLSRPIRYHIYQSRKRYRTEKLKIYAQATLTIVSILLLIAPLLMILSGIRMMEWEYILPLMIAGLAGIITASIWKYIRRPKIQASAQPDGWVRLAGINHIALRKLKIIERARHQNEAGRTFPSGPQGIE